MMNQPNQQALLRFIYETGFAIDDVVLYPDTHPCDEEALKYYCQYKEMLQQAMEEYTQFYGPLSNENVNAANKWLWIRDPWPWEGVC